MNKLHLS